LTLLNHDRKIERPEFVETPGRRTTRSRASITPDTATDMSDSSLVSKESRSSPRKRKTATKVKEEDASQDGDNVFKANGHANGHANGSTKAPRVVDGWEEGKDPKIDYSGHFEFGGSFGVLAMMIGFPLLMYYMWIGATYYDGKFPTPAEGQTMTEFFSHLGQLAYEGAFPSLKAWTIYWVFFVFEGICYVLLPGITIMGRPLAQLGGKQLPYYCSAVWSFYTTLGAALALHFSGLFKLYTIIDEFGPLMSVAILSGFLVSFIAYFSALARGAQHRMTGYPIYDFFMGAELNPRMFGILDFKMFFEVRLPWYILLLVTMGAAARQWEVYGYVSGEVGFLLMAHFLYANACSKGEECIVSTW
jgi:delta24(24(1))-sterol reductase